METSLFKIICALAETSSAKITAQNLKERHSVSVSEKLFASNALIKAPHNQDVDAIVDDEERSYAAKRHNDGMAYFSPKAGWTTIDNEDLLVFQVNLDMLLRVVMDALGILVNVQPETVLDSKVWFLGSAWLNKRETPVILGRRLIDQDSAETLRNYLQDKHSHDPALVLAISSNIPAYFQLPGQSRLVLMNDAIDTQSQTLALNTQYLAEKMGASVDQPGFSEGFRILKTHDDQVFKFSKKKASVLEVMHNAGKPMHQEEIMAQSGSVQNRLIDLFRNDPARKIIFKNDGSGNYWLEY